MLVISILFPKSAVISTSYGLSGMVNVRDVTPLRSVGYSPLMVMVPSSMPGVLFLTEGVFVVMVLEAETPFFMR